MTSKDQNGWTEDQVTEALRTFEQNDPALYEITIICTPSREAMIFTLVSQGYLSWDSRSDPSS